MTLERRIEGTETGQQSGTVEFSTRLEERLERQLGVIARKTESVVSRRPKSDKGV